VLAKEASAEDLPTIPRKASEKSVGGVKLGQPLPPRFAKCQPSPPSSEDIQRWGGRSSYLSYSYRASDKTVEAYLRILQYCEHNKCKVTSIDLVAVDATSKSATEMCTAPLPLAELATSGGVRLGDSVRKVREKYGPPSYDFHKSGVPYYFGYTPGRSFDDGPKFDFQIDSHGTIVEIRIEDGMIYD
jgi:hypothetical protein